ncbi:putative bifunctional diguanylate cyclase/phosphodiesterase [Thalassolituus sp. LLYu03]|uniref:putative bifunctional diguanylate cyclase/phosphodiesterase n=1 Tax=Thalassolituus sp. LLYu03 TaxID=3421656 RepID=UPI003D2E7517
MKLLPRHSLKRILLTWSALALGITVLIVSYFLYQTLTSQFSQNWQNKIDAELSSLRMTLHHQLSESDWTLADQSLSRMGTRLYIQHLMLVTDNRIRLSNRRADIGQTYLPEQLPAHLTFDGSELQIHQDGTVFHAVMPVNYRADGLHTIQPAWLIAHYDASHQYQILLHDTLHKILLLIGLLVLYTIGLLNIMTRQVLSPLDRLVEFTRALRDGSLGDTIHSQTSTEFSHLEGAFNSLSRHLKHTVQQVHDQHMRDQAFTRAFPDVAFLIDNDGFIQGRYGSGDSPVAALKRLMPDEYYSIWVNPKDAPALEANRQLAISSHDTVISEFRFDAFYLESRMTPLLDDSDSSNITSSGVLWLIRDISDVKRKQQMIEYQANFDSLTNLANRRFALLHINKKIAHARRAGKFGAVLFIDLDHFKNINDSLGHPIGDQLLIEMGGRLSSAVRDEDLTARLGGDEFLVSFDDLADSPEAAASLASDGAERLLAIIRQPLKVDVNTFHLSASIGIAIFPNNQQDAADLVRQADTAMYHAKGLGRNGISVYTDNMQQETQDKLNLFNDLHQAIQDKSFTLVFQPQLNDQGEVTGAEVLCRWTNKGQPVRPDIFIAAAEETRLILPLGDWILMETCRRLKHWREMKLLPPSFRKLAVNISPAQFMEGNFEHKLEAEINDTGLCSRQIELEITESIFMGDKDLIRSKMERLSELGFSFALDDFGTGYSSLSYLQNLPINKLKIDRSFILDIGDDGQPARLVDSIIQLGRNLNMDIIAEGVETEAQRDYLKAHDCHEYQGYLYSKPLTETEFLEFVRHNSGNPTADY